MRRLRNDLPKWFAEIDGGLESSRTDDQRVSMTDFLERVSAILAEGIEQAFGLEALVKILQTIKVT